MRKSSAASISCTDNFGRMWTVRRVEREAPRRTELDNWAALIQTQNLDMIDWIA